MDLYYKTLLDNNKKWSEALRAKDRNFFDNLVNQQKPPVLWIGCSDSRVPANEITGTLAGEIFVHRNIANMVVHTDLNMLSVLDYAVSFLKVKHVIVCGHYGCGGVQAALQNKSLGLINKWLRNLKEVYRENKNDIDALKNETERVDHLVELNVKAQVKELAKISIVQKAWSEKQELSLHGWVYGLKDGIIKDLNVSINSASSLEDIFVFDFD